MRRSGSSTKRLARSSARRMCLGRRRRRAHAVAGLDARGAACARRVHRMQSDRMQSRLCRSRCAACTAAGCWPPPDGSRRHPNAPLEGAPRAGPTAARDCSPACHHQQTTSRPHGHGPMARRRPDRCARCTGRRSASEGGRIDTRPCSCRRAASSSAGRATETRLDVHANAKRLSNRPVHERVLMRSTMVGALPPWPARALRAPRVPARPRAHSQVPTFRTIAGRRAASPAAICSAAALVNAHEYQSRHCRTPIGRTHKPSQCRLHFAQMAARCRQEESAEPPVTGGVGSSRNYTARLILVSAPQLLSGSVWLEGSIAENRGLISAQESANPKANEYEARVRH